MKAINLFYLITALVITTSCEPAFLIKEQSRNLSDYSYTSHDLPQELVEISGLEVINDEFYGFNDSGGNPEIYKFNDTNPVKITQTIRLENAKNIDWEEMAMSDKYLFIGDFGNNLGTRKDLKIYYINRNDINPNQDNQKVKYETFGFFYPEQTTYENQGYNHDFDLEAMVYFDGKLHLFTKEWKSLGTKHYTLDIVTGKQPAWLVENYDTNFMVTGADVIKLTDRYTRLGFVGYTQEGEVYLLLTDFKNSRTKWLKNPKTVIHLGKAGDIGQVEGISFKSKDEVCYSAEAIEWEGISRSQNLTCISLK